MASSDIMFSGDQQLELSRIAQSRSLPAGYVFRARLILLLAEGASFSAIKQRLATTDAETMRRWLKTALHAASLEEVGIPSPESGTRS